MLLQCADNKFAPLAGCRGPAGCSSREDVAARMTNFRCDTTLGQEGDVCELANDFTCATDRKAVLVCTGNKWTVHKACGSPCSIDANSAVSCNGVVAGRSGGGEHAAPTALAAKTAGAKTSAPADAGAPASKTTPDAGAAKPATATDAGVAAAVDAGAKPPIVDAGAAKPAVKDAGAPKRR